MKSPKKKYRGPRSTYKNIIPRVWDAAMWGRYSRTFTGFYPLTKWRKLKRVKDMLIHPIWVLGDILNPSRFDHEWYAR